MRDPSEPKYPIYDQDDQEKLRNELLISFFIPASVTIIGLALLFRFVIGDVLVAIHPAFAEQIDWGAGKYSSVWATARTQLLLLIGATVLLVYYWAYLTRFRAWFRERGWV